MADTNNEVFNKILPYLSEHLKGLGLLRRSGSSGGGGGGAPSPHALSSSHHTGTLTPSQFPDALLRDGSRSLLGNLSVASGVTIDGVQLSAFKTLYDAHASSSAVAAHGSVGAHNHQSTAAGGQLDHNAALTNLTVGDPHTQYLHLTNARTITAVHTFSPSSATAPFLLASNAQGQTVVGFRADQLARTVAAGNGMTGGGTLTGDITLHVVAGDATITVGADDLRVNQAATFTWTGAHTFQATINAQHILPQLNDTYDLGSDTLRWRQAFISELETLILRQRAVIAVDGEIILAKQNGTLDAALAAAATTATFGQAMTVGNLIYITGNNAVEYLTVGSLVSGTTYNVTRNVDGSGANDWAQGQAWINFGAVGDMRIVISGGASNTPRVSLVRQGATYNSIDRIVNLASVGLQILASSVYTAGRAYTFVDPADGTTTIGGLGASVSGGPNVNQLELRVETISGDDSRILIQANVGGTDVARVRSEAVHSSKTTRLDLQSSSSLGQATLTADLLTYASGRMALGGTSFPSAPSSGEVFYRTDFRAWFHYDGVTWQQTSVGSFASFPASPVLNLRVHRTDYDLTFFYDGAMWLSVNEYPLTMPYPRALQPVAAAGVVADGLLEQRTGLVPYVTDLVVRSNPQTTNTGANYHTVTINALTAAAVVTQLATFNTSADTVGVNTRRMFTPNVLLTSSDLTTNINTARTGAPGNLFITVEGRYRLRTT